MTTATEPTIDPAEHVRQVEAEYTHADHTMRQTETRLQELDRAIAAAPGHVADLQQQLYSLLSHPSDSPAYSKKVSDLQNAIRDTERQAEDRQRARGPLAQHYQQEQMELNQLQENVRRARAGLLWQEFQAALVPLDEALRAAEVAWNAASVVAQRIAVTAPHLGGSSRASDQLEQVQALIVRGIRESSRYQIEFPRCHD